MYPDISIVVPVYRGEPFIVELTKRIEQSMKENSLEYEVILVNDYSPDKSWEIIETICRQNPQIKGINLSRNFGQHYAITAGIEHANGSWIAVMDCDLQDIPEEIPKLYSKAKEGYDIVLGQREYRNDSIFKVLFSFLFYRVLSWLTGVKYDHKVANFGIYHNKVIKAILSMGDSIRFFPSMVKWVGFRSTTMIVEHGGRSEGKSSYNFKRLLDLALDIILSYSDKPIRLTIKTGFLISVLAFFAAIFTLIKALYGKIEVQGYASIIISIWFFSGLIISIIGIVGLYVSKTFQSVRRRPVYIAEHKINLQN